MNKIFHVISHFELGGAEKVAYNISISKSNKFKYHIFEVVKARSDYSKGLINDLKNRKIKIHRSSISNKKLAILFFPIRMLVACVVYKPHVIHSHTEIPNLSVFLFSKIAKFIFPNLKYCRTIHNTKLWSKWESIGSIVEPFFILNNANIAISHSTKLNYKKQYGQKQIPLIFNGLEAEKQKEFKFIKPNKINILFAGRFENQKGIIELIEVIKKLKNDKLFYFHVIGDGSLRAKVLSSLKSSDNVTIYTKIYNLASYLSSFDYLFMPSNFEGLSILSIEASFNKLPCIINNCEGLKDTLPEDWILKVNDNSVSQYLKIFKETLPICDVNSLKLQAYSYVKKYFFIKSMQASYQEIYSEKIK